MEAITSLLAATWTDKESADAAWAAGPSEEFAAWGQEYESVLTCDGENRRGYDGLAIGKRQTGIVQLVMLMVITVNTLMKMGGQPEKLLVLLGLCFS